MLVLLCRRCLTPICHCRRMPDAAAAAAAEQELARVFAKPDFLRLAVLGQFNLGFILCRLGGSRDLFIVDQHASGEGRWGAGAGCRGRG